MVMDRSLVLLTKSSVILDMNLMVCQIGSVKKAHGAALQAPVKVSFVGCVQMGVRAMNFLSFGQE